MNAWRLCLGAAPPLHFERSYILHRQGQAAFCLLWVAVHAGSSHQVAAAHLCGDRDKLRCDVLRLGYSADSDRKPADNEGRITGSMPCRIATIAMDTKRAGSLVVAALVSVSNSRNGAVCWHAAGRAPCLTGALSGKEPCQQRAR